MYLNVARYIQVRKEMRFSLCTSQNKYEDLALSEATHLMLSAAEMVVLSVVVVRQHSPCNSQTLSQITYSLSKSDRSNRHET